MENSATIQPALPRTIEELRGRKDPAAMKAVAKEMEAMFAYEMIKVMRETTTLSSTEGLGSDTYMSMFDQELSKLFAERGLGMQDMFEQGMQRMAEKTGNAPEKQGQLTLKNDDTLTLENEIKPLLPDAGHPRVSSGYGTRNDPFDGNTAFHHGLDIAASEGTDIHPVRNGTVLFSGEQKGYGNVVIIDHGDGFQSKYAHNQANLVQLGQQVDTGSVIAQVGSTGRSTGPHMHFEVLYKGKQVDPETLLAQG